MTKFPIFFSIIGEVIEWVIFMGLFINKYLFNIILFIYLYNIYDHFPICLALLLVCLELFILYRHSMQLHYPSGVYFSPRQLK